MTGPERRVRETAATNDPPRPGRREPAPKDVDGQPQARERSRPRPQRLPKTSREVRSVRVSHRSVILDLTPVRSTVG